jgi:catechol 2,3-dioxygenase-like lactoylglutathione lyase family enzyme
VLFVADVNRALRFYIDMLGFEKRWHDGDGADPRAFFIGCGRATFAGARS